MTNEPKKLYPHLFGQKDERQRKSYEKLLETDPELLSQELANCKADPWYFITGWVKTLDEHDPKNPGGHVFAGVPQVDPGVDFGGQFKAGRFFVKAQTLGEKRNKLDRPFIHQHSGGQVFSFFEQQPEHPDRLRR